MRKEGKERRDKKAKGKWIKEKEKRREKERKKRKIYKKKKEYEETTTKKKREMGRKGTRGGEEIWKGKYEEWIEKRRNKEVRKRGMKKKEEKKSEVGKKK